MYRVLKICLAVLFVAFNMSSCKKINKSIEFRLDFSTEVIVPSSTGINIPFNVITPEVETNAEASFAANDTRKDLIEEINLEELRISIKSPQGEDFSFLKSVVVFIKADGFEEKQIASLDNVPENVFELDLVPTGEDLAPYVKAESFSLRVKTVTDELITRDHELLVFSKFRVKAKLI
jgi:hypothetical protein